MPLHPATAGGPAIAGDKIIGLAFSKLGGDTQTIGYRHGSAPALRDRAGYPLKEWDVIK